MRNEEIENYMKTHATNYPTLFMSITSSTLNFDKKNYFINPYGMINSPRKEKDGIVLFGTSKSNKIINDFSFPLEYSEVKEGDEFPNFSIYFNVQDESYYIKDFNTGLGALMKISSVPITENTLINVGSNYLVISFEQPLLTVKIFNAAILQDKIDGMTQEKFKTVEIKVGEEDQSITIGRSQKCNIMIEDMMLSKIQCRIEYKGKTKELILVDGDGYKESTNGTWVYILNPAKIHNNFLFKAEHTLFLISLSKNADSSN